MAQTCLALAQRLAEANELGNVARDAIGAPRLARGVRDEAPAALYPADFARGRHDAIFGLVLARQRRFKRCDDARAVLRMHQRNPGIAILVEIARLAPEHRACRGADVEHLARGYGDRPDHVGQRGDDGFQPLAERIELALRLATRGALARGEHRVAHRGRQPAEAVLPHVIVGAQTNRLNCLLFADRARDDDQQLERAQPAEPGQAVIGEHHVRRRLEGADEVRFPGDAGPGDVVAGLAQRPCHELGVGRAILDLKNPDLFLHLRA